MSDYVSDKFCDDCHFYKPIYGESWRCCHYIFMTGKKRPCPPGAGCTEKVGMKVNRRKKRRGDNV